MIDLTHDIKRTLSVWWITGIFIGIIYFGWTGYITFVKPHTNPNPTNTQTADTIQNNYNSQNSKAFALISWGRFHLIAVDGKPITPVLKERIITKTIEIPEISTVKVSPLPYKKKHWYFLGLF
jgi:beta-lactamase regulating signal transducer with metallopeptidase domain